MSNCINSMGRIVCSHSPKAIGLLITAIVLIERCALVFILVVTRTRTRTGISIPFLLRPTAGIAKRIRAHLCRLLITI